MFSSNTTQVAAAGGAEDTNFQNVTMLLSGDGTNGAQNNTFVDGSTNNFSITRNGNTTQGTFSPYGTSWSIYLNGSSYVTSSYNSAFDMVSNPFTIEAWIFCDATDSYRPILSTYGGSSSGWAMQVYNSKLYFAASGDGFDISGTTTLQVGRWYHVAVSGTGGTSIKLFLDGVQEGSTYTGSFNDSLSPLYAGYLAGSYFNGYISNARIIKGTALYTSNFTPPTAPLTAVTNTSWLTCKSNRFVDNSSNAFSVSTGGTSTKIQRFSPFNPTSAYSTSVIGGSGYFDGTGDYLNLTTSSALGVGTGTYTVECWVYASSAPAYSSFLQIDTTGLQFGVNASGYIAIAQQNVNFTVSSSTAVPLNTWSHIAASRDGSNVTRIFLNGVQIASATDTTNFSTGTTAYINHNSGNSAKVTGYITDVRLLKGTALYTSAFTPPTAPMTAITNTSLLLNYTNAGIYDSAMIGDMETVGNAQISTSVVKYGTGSLYFDGTGDYLVFPSDVNSNLAFRTGDFTIEFWAWKSANGAGGYDGVISADNTGNANGGFSVELSSNRGFVFYNDSGIRISYSMNPNDSTWHHYAVVRSNGTMALYKDGTQLTTATYTGDLGATPTLRVGSISTSSPFNGYIDDLRVTKGLARYTSNFTAPTAALPNY